MKNNTLHHIIVLLLSTFIFSNLYSETIVKSNNNLNENNIKPFKFYLDNSEHSYLQFGVYMQFWYRNMEMNNGSIDRGSEIPIDNYQDFSMRRMRFSALINYDDTHYIYTLYGITNEGSYDGLHSAMYFHDLWYKAKIYDKTYIGLGLHMWDGLSRLSNVASTAQLTLDNPAVNFPNVNVSDDFVRQYGIFIHGQFRFIDYQFSINQPMLSIPSSNIKNDSEIIAINNIDVAYNRYHNNFKYSGYTSFSLLNIEDVSITPFKKMTYFGKKGSFLNLGIGAQYIANASGILKEKLSGDKYLEYKPQTSLSSDLWYELPLPNKSVLNIYTVYYKYLYGDNYLKSGAVLNGFASSNPNEETPAQGAGISQYTIGTGDAIHFSLSYVIPNNIYISNKKIMPFYAITYKNYEGLNEEAYQQDFGIHYLIFGNNIKLSSQYSTRAIYNYKSLKIDEYKGVFILQLNANL